MSAHVWCAFEEPAPAPGAEPVCPTRATVRVHAHGAGLSVTACPHHIAWARDQITAAGYTPAVAPIGGQR